MENFRYYPFKVFILWQEQEILLKNNRAKCLNIPYNFEIKIIQCFRIVYLENVLYFTVFN